MRGTWRGGTRPCAGRELRRRSPHSLRLLPHATSREVEPSALAALLAGVSGDSASASRFPVEFERATPTLTGYGWSSSGRRGRRPPAPRRPPAGRRGRASPKRPRARRRRRSRPSSARRRTRRRRAPSDSPTAADRARLVGERELGAGELGAQRSAVPTTSERYDTLSMFQSGSTGCDATVTTPLTPRCAVASRLHGGGQEREHGAR